MNRVEKSKLAIELKDKFSKAKVAIFANYKGLSATQADDLRRQLRVQNAEVKVLKNNVARLVTQDGAMGDGARALMDEVTGPTLVAFGFADPAVTAKIIHQFLEKNEALKLKESLMGQKCISVSEVEMLAELPSREVLVARFLGTLNAPVQNFVGVLAAVSRSLVTVLAAIEKKKAEVQSS